MHRAFVRIRIPMKQVVTEAEEEVVEGAALTEEDKLRTIDSVKLSEGGTKWVECETDDKALAVIRSNPELDDGENFFITN
jgi:hypothetical protein